MSSIPGTQLDPEQTGRMSVQNSHAMGERGSRGWRTHSEVVEWPLERVSRELSAERNWSLTGEGDGMEFDQGGSAHSVVDCC